MFVRLEIRVWEQVEILKGARCPVSRGRAAWKTTFRTALCRTTWSPPEIARACQARDSGLGTGRDPQRCVGGMRAATRKRAELTLKCNVW